MDFSKKTLVELREIAKEKGLKGITALRKPELIQRLMEVSEEKRAGGYAGENDGEKAGFPESTDGTSDKTGKTRPHGTE